MTTIAIVDYGMGNLNSVEQALKHVCDKNQRVIIGTDRDTINNADKIVFPGQGAARACMHAIKEKGLVETLVTASREKPFLGICMGLQVLMTHSEENEGTDCLDIFAGEVKHLAQHIDAKPNHKIPHMGWNRVKQTRPHPLWEHVGNNSFFYFVHSYHTCPSLDATIAATSEYGEPFVCALAQDFIFAVQFHPEKSADAGLNILRNFAFWDGGG